MLWTFLFFFVILFRRNKDRVKIFLSIQRFVTVVCVQFYDVAKEVIDHRLELTFLRDVER